MMLFEKIYYNIAGKFAWSNSIARACFIEALKKLELLSATPRATLKHLSCSPNFPRASYLDERTLTYEPIVN